MKVLGIVYLSVVTAGCTLLTDPGQYRFDDEPTDSGTDGRLDGAQDGGRVGADAAGRDSAGTDANADGGTLALRWTDVTPASMNPRARKGLAMAYHPVRDHVVLFGGLASPSTDLGDTWIWTGSSWSDLTPTAAGPPQVRNAHAMAYDETDGRVVLFGGGFPTTTLMETWIWSGLAWTNETPVGSTSPQVRAFAAMAPGRNSSGYVGVLLYGGINSGGLISSAGSEGRVNWFWNGSGWEDITFASTERPSPRRGHAMAYDSERQRTVLFGGDDGSVQNDTWERDPSGTWTRVVASGEEDSPPARRVAAMAYDPTRRRTVLFGGTTGSRVLQDTWEWDGDTWTDVTPSPPAVSPPAREAAAMAFDGTGVIVFGGASSSGNDLGDTWRFEAIAE